MLLPAVDVADGQAVRPIQGEAGTATTCGSARDAALAWQAGGAEWIHLVDLDAAFGRGSNAELLAAVIGELDVKVELSGGICDDASLERALSTGCARVNLSTAALDDPVWCSRAIAAHGERIAVSLDVRVVEDPDGSVQHRLAARGWSHEGGDLWETIAGLDRDGCARYVVTDVSKDGMLRGPNVELYRAVTRATTAPVIASGGISAIGDLVLLAEVAAAGVNLEGSIVGKSLYAGRFTLPEALEAMRRVDVAHGWRDGRRASRQASSPVRTSTRARGEGPTSGSCRSI
jgi:1-(5-phosphoribosyl)-5-[(5-phosphoribosylamino)methylideneamino] imidazole-4-carboxamide isomerase/N-(5'phosphoribosyl)anthranilate isomerase